MSSWVSCLQLNTGLIWSQLLKLFNEISKFERHQLGEGCTILYVKQRHDRKIRPESWLECLHSNLSTGIYCVCHMWRVTHGPARQRARARADACTNKYCICCMVTLLYTDGRKTINWSLGRTHTHTPWPTHEVYTLLASTYVCFPQIVTGWKCVVEHMLSLYSTDLHVRIWTNPFLWHSFWLQHWLARSFCRWLFAVTSTRCFLNNKSKLNILFCNRCLSQGFWEYWDIFCLFPSKVDANILSYKLCTFFFTCEKLASIPEQPQDTDTWRIYS